MVGKRKNAEIDWKSGASFKNFNFFIFFFYFKGQTSMIFLRIMPFSVILVNRYWLNFPENWTVYRSAWANDLINSIVLVFGLWHPSCVCSLFSGQWDHRKLRIYCHKWTEINDMKYVSASMYIWLHWSSFCRIFAVVFCSWWFCS